MPLWTLVIILCSLITQEFKKCKKKCFCFQYMVVLATLKDHKTTFILNLKWNIFLVIFPFMTPANEMVSACLKHCFRRSQRWQGRPAADLIVSQSFENNKTFRSSIKEPSILFCQNRCYYIFRSTWTNNIFEINSVFKSNCQAAY